MNPLPVPDPTVGVVYRRVSSTDQRDHGYGLDAQAEDCKRAAQAEGLTVVADFAEDARSTVPLDERRAGAAALDAMMRLGAGVLLVARRDRLARDPYVAGHAKRAVAMMGGRIVYAEGGNGDSDANLFMDDMRHAVNAHERRAIVARLRDGREAKARKAAERGERAYIGGRPAFGYRADPETHELVIDHDAAEVVRSIFDMARSGRSVRAIVAALNADQAGGRNWYPESVMRVLNHDAYRRAYPGRIIDGKVFNAAHAALASRRKRAA